MIDMAVLSACLHAGNEWQKLNFKLKFWKNSSSAQENLIDTRSKNLTKQKFIRYLCVTEKVN